MSAAHNTPLTPSGEKAQTDIRHLEQQLAEASEASDSLHYQLGNAYRKTGNWAQALYHYAEYEELNPQSPAASASRMLMDILNFYHKDMYNP